MVLVHLENNRFIEIHEEGDLVTFQMNEDYSGIGFGISSYQKGDWGKIENLKNGINYKESDNPQSKQHTIQVGGYCESIHNGTQKYTKISPKVFKSRVQPRKIIKEKDFADYKYNKDGLFVSTIS